jgi:hypothetical protein
MRLYTLGRYGIFVATDANPPFDRGRHGNKHEHHPRVAGFAARSRTSHFILSDVTHRAPPG